MNLAVIMVVNMDDNVARITTYTKIKWQNIVTIHEQFHTKIKWQNIVTIHEQFHTRENDIHERFSELLPLISK